MIGTYLGGERTIGSVALLLATLYDLKVFSDKALENTVILIKTGLNERAMQEVCSYLEEEVYPILPYHVDVGECVLYYVEKEHMHSSARCTVVVEESKDVQSFSSFYFLLYTDYILLSMERVTQLLSKRPRNLKEFKVRLFRLIYFVGYHIGSWRRSHFLFWNGCCLSGQEMSIREKTLFRWSALQFSVMCRRYSVYFFLCAELSQQ